MTLNLRFACESKKFARNGNNSRQFGLIAITIVINTGELFLMRKSTKRKRQYGYTNTLVLAMSGIRPMGDEDLKGVRSLELSSIEAMAKGHGTAEIAMTLVEMLELTDGIAKRVIGPEALPSCNAMRAGLKQIAKHHAATGSWTITETDLQAFRDVYAYHEAQRTTVNASVYADAIYRTRNLLRGSGRHTFERWAAK